MNNVALFFDEVRESFPAINVTGFFCAKDADFNLNLETPSFVNKPAILEFCKIGLVSGKKANQFIDLSFSRRHSLLFQYVGDDTWIILGGKGLLSHQLRAFVSKLQIVREGLAKEEAKEKKVKKTAKTKKLVASGKEDKAKRNSPIEKNKSELEASTETILDRFPEIWQKDQIEIDKKKTEYSALSRSAYKLRRKQYLNFYNQLKTVGFEKIFTNYFLLTNSKLEGTRNFFWHKKIGALHYFFLVKSNNPKLDPIIHYYNLSNNIDKLDGDPAPDPQKLYKKIKKIVRDLVLSFNENMEEELEDYVGVFCLDEKTLKMTYSCNGFYFSSIRPKSNSIIIEKFNGEKLPEHGEYNLNNGERYFIFSEEILKLHKGSENGQMKAMKEHLLSCHSKGNLSKKKLEATCHDLQDKNEIAPDYLLCYVEIK